ncbi:hypothetical protein EV182_001213, partial [Spiromyces aspiralis]
ARGRRIVLTKRQSTESPSGASSMPPRPTINLPQAYATSLTLDVRNVYAYKSQRPYCVLTGGYNSGSKPDSVPFPPMMSPPISFSSNTSSASSGDETAPPPVIRKKTGEIVKSCLKSPGRSLSCSNIPVSSPGLPYGIPSPPKFVHFGTELEQIRFFLQAETPVDVCRDAFDRSPEPIDGTSDTLPSTKSSMCAPGEAAPGKLVIKAVNGPNPMFSTYEQSPVVLETLILDGRTVRGTVKVHNIAYTKTVYARYTLNTWKTIDEVGASFQSQIASPEDGRCGVDRFKFSFAIPDAKLEEIRKSALTLSLCIRYAVAGQEFWDNNNGSNYCFCLFYIPTTSPAPSSPTSAASGFLGSRLRIRSFSDSSLPSLAFRDDQDDDYCYAADDDDDGAKIRTSMRRLKKDMVSPPRGAGGMLQPTQLSFLAPTKLKPAQKDASIASTTTATTAAAAAPESGTGNTATGSSSGKRSPSTQIPTVSPNDTRRYMQMSEAPYSSAVTTFPAGSDGISALSSSSSSARPGHGSGGGGTIGRVAAIQQVQRQPVLSLLLRNTTARYSSCRHSARDSKPRDLEPLRLDW